jgi:DNA-binding CsgD family transcriptional regulator
MPTLRTHELRQVADIAELLVSPFSLGTLDDWRREVNRRTRVLLGADSAGFLLPTDRGPTLFSEEHDPASLARYPEIENPPLSDGTTTWQHGLKVKVGTIERVYGDDYHLYVNSAYYNEYAAPNGAHDTLFAITTALGGELRTAAALQYWHARPTGPRFGDRELLILAALFPAFRAGIQAYVSWWRHRESLARTLDVLGQATSIWNASGVEVHRTPAYASLAAADGAATLVAEVANVAQSVLAFLQPAMKSRRGTRTLGADVTVAGMRFAIAGAIHLMPHEHEPPIVLVNVTRSASQPLTVDEVCRRRGLTPAEARVALLLADGYSNRQLAQELGIAEATARRHTERIFAKLAVSNRASVGAALRQ